MEWSQAVFCCARQQDKRQGAQPEIREVPSAHKKKLHCESNKALNRLPRGAVESVSLEVFRTHLCVILGNMI